MPEYTSWDATEDETPLWEEFCKTPEGTRFQFTGDFGTQHGVHKGRGHLELQSLTGVYNLKVGDPKNGYISSTSGLPNVTKASWEIVLPWEGALVICDRHGDVWVKNPNELYSVPNEDGTLSGSASFNEIEPAVIDRKYGPIAVILDSKGTYVGKDVKEDDEDEPIEWPPF